METQVSKTVFIEYSSFIRGQHFMTVVQTQDHQRIIIGRMYKEYDQQNKKMMYRATDFAGNPVFEDAKELSEIKRKFIECGPTMALTVPAMLKPRKEKEGLPPIQKQERKEEVKNIRSKKSEKEKTKEHGKTQLMHKEMEHELKNEKTETTSKDGQQHSTDPIEKNSNRDETEVQNSREDELDQIREQNQERDDDMDLER